MEAVRRLREDRSLRSRATLAAASFVGRELAVATAMDTQAKALVLLGSTKWAQKALERHLR